MAASSQDLMLYGTESRDDALPITTTLIPSNLGTDIIYSTYPHNLHSSPPLLMSRKQPHSLTLYHEWLLGLGWKIVLKNDDSLQLVPQNGKYL